MLPLRLTEQRQCLKESMQGGGATKRASSFTYNIPSTYTGEIFGLLTLSKSVSNGHALIAEIKSIWNFMKKIVYVDMDNVLVDFQSAFPKLSKKVLNEYENNKDDIPGIFALMEPMPSAIESFIELTKHFETYVLSTAPWNNSSAWSDKLLWVKKYLGEHALKRLILTHHKNLNMGDYLIDDRLKRGADSFAGEHIHFGTEKFPDWASVMKYLRSKERL